MRLHSLLLWTATTLGLLGCSAQDATRHGNVMGVSGGAGGGVAGPAAPSGAGGSFGNSSGSVTGNQPLQNGGGDAGAAPSTGGGVMPVKIDQCGASNPAGLSDADAQKLVAGSGSAGSIRVLYPYDGTVFPRGMISPMLMWDGGGDFIYLHIKSKAFEYLGCLKPSANGQIQIPQDVWDAATARTYGTTDPFAFELGIMTGGVATGPARFSITIAQATIKGSIYYNSYASKLAAAAGGGAIIGGGGGPGGGQGAVLRIPGGKNAEVFLNSSGCNACHSVSANGSRMISLPLGASLIGPASSSSYALTTNGSANPAALAATLENAAFVGLAPDGSVYATSAHQNGVGPRPGSPVTTGGPNAGLYATDTGAAISGSGLPTGAMTPMFSPAGTELAFTDYAINAGHGLATMTFDPKARTASNYKQVYTTPDATHYAAWPFYLPDSKGLVFALGTSADFSGNGAGLNLGASATAPASDLYMLDLGSGKASVLARAMGLTAATGDATYLPFGAEELHRNYYPTVAPVAAGGYFWVFFDSLRHYGNQGLQRQIWGAAVDISANGDYTVDRSHPAFYLPGQEPNTGNHRAFAALDPCKQDGDSCTTGIDCCGGYCYVPMSTSSEFAIEEKGTCKKPVTPTCSKRDERCVTSADCCKPTGGELANSCIGGFCAVVVPQ